jgi:Arabidopsis protein of unknown function
MASSLRSQRKTEKDIADCASALRGISKCRNLAVFSDAKEIEIAGIIMEAISTTSFTFMAIFAAIGSLSAAASSKKYSGTMRSLKKLPISSSFMKRATCREEDIDILERFQEFDECIQNVDCFSERVFRSLMNSRVLLLNIMTPCL